MSLFSKFKNALEKTSSKITVGISNILAKKKLDAETLEDLEEVLLRADLGVSTTNKIVQAISKIKFDKKYDHAQVTDQLIGILHETLIKGEVPLKLDESIPLNIVMICGVNGNGKTTTIGKLAARFLDQGLKVMLAACDTYRAAAVEQLVEWGERVNVPVFTDVKMADPGSVAYKAINKAREQKIDVLLIDTAGRLHNYQNLMDELTKINNVIRKQDALAPHHTILTLDATTGQNAFNQMEHFKKAVNLTGIILTKLDGTAKAGIILGLIEKFNIPVHFIGIGEQKEDLRVFDAQEFANALINTKEVNI